MDLVVANLSLPSLISTTALPKLAELGCEGTIIGKAIYEERISLKQLEEFIINK